MADRPILFSAPMVRALLAGTKTQTRRAIKNAPEGFHMDRVGPTGFQWTAPAGAPRIPFTPRFAVGDRLWVRESWDFIPLDEPKPEGSGRAEIVYWADADRHEFDVPPGFNPMVYGQERFRPSIHMPRWASRLTLTVTDVRVQRLQDISEEDARAEGADEHTAAAIMDADERHALTAALMLAPDAYHRVVFETLWEKINGAGSWNANPWVAVYGFTVEPRNIDQREAG